MTELYQNNEVVNKDKSDIQLLNEALARLGYNLNLKIDNENVLKIELPEARQLQDVFPEDRITKIFDRLIDQVIDFLITEMGLQINSEHHHNNIRVEKSREFMPISSWVLVPGIFAGLFVIGIEKELAEYLADKFIIGGLINNNQKNEYLADSLGEIVNIIVGGCADIIHETLGNLIPEVPVMILNRVVKCHCSESNILTSSIKTNRGDFEISTIVAEFEK